MLLIAFGRRFEVWFLGGFMRLVFVLAALMSLTFIGGVTAFFILISGAFITLVFITLAFATLALLF
jgi:uncharacterized membrane protein